MESKIIKSDVLIIGSGGAGSRAAIEVSKHGLKPLIVSKGLSFKSGCTGMAEGGYNAVFSSVDPEDTKKTHFEDTLKGGAYLNDKALVEILVDEAPDRLIDLENFGALFDRTNTCQINQRPFGGQTFRRTCFQGDRTGHEIITALKEEITKRNIETIEEVMITSLILNTEENKVIGAIGLNLKDSITIFFQAKSVILASGGAGQLFPITSNTSQKNGDGYALSWRVGCDLIDMEEIQFHPTGMITPESKKGVLVTEAVRAEGGILLNNKNERFMKKYDSRGELATRDVVARSIYQEISEGRGTKNGGVYLDISGLNDDIIDEKLETMVLQFEDVGVDIKNEPMEVAPTAHHFMGGVKIDEEAKTTVSNLYAAGEVAGGVHGANRLGGNALAETQVFGKIAGESAAINVLTQDFQINGEMILKEENRIKNLFKKGSIKPSDVKKEIQKLMWENVSIIKIEDSLNKTLSRLLEIQKEIGNFNIPPEKQYNTELENALEVINMVEIAIIIVKSAILRRESRGSHFRKDFPETSKNWDKSIVMNKKKIKFIQR